jgi:hypothetical protein
VVIAPRRTPDTLVVRASHRTSTPADGLYLALGRFVVEFSQFVQNLRFGVIDVGVVEGRYPESPDGAPPKVLEILTAEMTAEPLRKAFFAACHALANLDPDEEKIRDDLAKRAADLIQTRNAVQHGLWMGDASGPDTGWEVPLAAYERLAFNPEGISGSRSIERTIPELERMADEAAEMVSLIAAFADGCSRQCGNRVRDVLRLHSGRVVRR